MAINRAPLTSLPPYIIFIIEARNRLFCRYIGGFFMKTVKLVLLSILTFAIPAVAIDLKHVRTKQLLVAATTRQASADLLNVIENCHKNDGKHELRMRAFLDSSHNLSARQCKPCFELHNEHARRKFIPSARHECK